MKKNFLKSMEPKILKLIGVKGTFKDSVVPMMNYSCANISTSGAGYVISLYFSLFLTSVVHLSMEQAGFIMMIAMVWDAIVDPAIGIINDRTRSKHGKHRRYILWATPLFCVSFAMMWNGFGLDAAEKPTQTMIYYIVVYILYKTAYSLVDVSHVAMLPELAPEYDLRTQYNSVGYIFNSFGMFPSFFVMMLVLNFCGFSDGPTSEAKKPMLIVGCVLSLIYGLFLIRTFKKTRERPSEDLKLEKFDFKFFINEYIYVFKNKSFREYFFMSLFYNISTYFYNTSLVYYIKYLANLYKYYGLFTTIAGVFEAGAFPLNYALTIKQGKKKCGNIVTPFMIAGFAMCLIMRPATGTGSNIFSIICLMLTAVFYPFGKSGLGYVATNILPDVTDVDELITGRRREGVISTFNSFVKQAISGFMTAVVMFIMGGFGLETGEVVETFEKANPGMMYQQTDSAIFGVRLCVAIIPIIFALISFFLLHKFQMNKPEHNLIRAAVATKHRYGSVRLTEEEKKIIETISGQKLENTWLGKDNDSLNAQPLEKDEDGNYAILADIEKEAEEARALKKAQDEKENKYENIL